MLVKEHAATGAENPRRRTTYRSPGERADNSELYTWSGDVGKSSRYKEEDKDSALKKFPCKGEVRLKSGVIDHDQSGV